MSIVHPAPGFIAQAIPPRHAALFAALFLYYLFYPHAGFVGMVPDNIAQTAYFKLLSRPHLVGSIGSSSPKGGLIVLLGLAHLISYEVLQSSWPFKAMLALFFSTTLFLINRIASELGGRFAGILAVLVTAGSTYLTATFFTASSNLFFIPFVLLGLWLLSKNHDRAAVLALSAAATIRPEALIIIAFIVVTRTLPARRWKEVVEFSVYAVAAFLFFVLMAYWVQGSWDRIGGGASTGYPAFASLRTIEHLRVTLGLFFADRFVALLLLPAVLTFVCVPQSRAYACFFTMFAAFVVLVVIGFFGMHFRYIAAAQTIVYPLGCAGIFLLRRALDESDTFRIDRRALVACGVVAVALLIIVYWAAGSYQAPALMLAVPAIYLLTTLVRHGAATHWVAISHGLVVTLVAGFAVWAAVQTRLEHGPLTSHLHPAISDGREFLKQPGVEPGASVLAEDEILNYVIVTSPDHLRRARSIQSFNVMPEADRRRAIQESEYLYISKRRNHGWNYLYYFPREEWLVDKFRNAVVQMLETNEKRTILGVTMIPVLNSGTRFVARIVPEAGE